MAERFKSPEPRSGNERLRSVAEVRKKYFDKLARSPWSWAAAAVMALESQGCATMSQAVGYMTLEPQSGGMKYDANVGQTGNFVGPTFKVESMPERPRGGIANLPEGYFTPELAEELHAARSRGGKMRDVPPGYIDLESLGYERGNQPFVIVRENHVGPPKIGRERNKLIAQEAARGLSFMSRMPYAFTDGIKTEWVEVTRYGEVQMTAPPPALNVDERAANMATTENRILPAGDTHTTLSCRVTPVPGTFAESARPKKPEAGRKLEFDVLHGNASLVPLRLVLSEEKSFVYPERPAQAALVTDYEPIPDLVTLYTAYEVLTQQEDGLTKRIHALEIRLPTLQGEEKDKATAQYARLSQQLTYVHVSRAYRETETKYREEIARLQTELATLRQAKQAKDRYDVNDLREGAAENKWSRKHIPELEEKIASLQREMAEALERLTPTSLTPLTAKLAGMIEPAKQRLMTAALGALGTRIATQTEVRIMTDIDATRGGIRLVVVLDNPKK